MSIKILSFNIWDIPFWFSVKREERIRRLGAYLKELDPEIICLQESFDVKHRSLLHEHLGKNTYRVIEEYIKSRRVLLFKRFDLTGGLVIFSKLPILKSKFVPFRRFVDMMFAEYIGRKGILEVLVQTWKGPLLIMNTHLHGGGLSLDRNIRLKQLRQLLQAAKAFKNKPTVIAGDFNENDMFKENGLAHLIRKGGFKDAGQYSKEEAKPTVRFGNRYASKTWFNRSSNSKRLDYILVNNLETFGWGVADYRVLEQPVNPISDHDPVMVVLE